jgi:hypothetical protein
MRRRGRGHDFRLTSPAARAAVVAQYLSRYASSEAALAGAVRARYRVVLVVPAFREPPSLLDGYLEAAASARGRVLIIVVVNAARACAEESWPEHRALLEGLACARAERLSSEPPAWLARGEACDVLAIDRASPEFCFPDKQGVGLARRIGCDLALALWARGQVERPYLYCSDADAILPRGHFEAEPEAPAGAIVFPFWHEPGGDPRIDAATAIYELGLRYYVAGLCHARSPYAFHAIGSALAVDAGSYAAVRGFPKRLSGEDFYLLDKVAKVGAIWRADQEVIRLASRTSSRTVHGTGVAAVRIAEELDQGTTRFYHPHIFSLSKHWLAAVERFASSRDLAGVRLLLASEAREGWRALEAVLDELGAFAALSVADRETRDPSALRARLHTWFDGFRTLKLIHGLRQRAFASLPYREALAASWSPVAGQAAAASVDGLRRALATHLTHAPPYQGVGAPSAPRH